MKRGGVVVLFVLLLVVNVDAAWFKSAKAISNFVWDLKERIPPKVREQIGVVFGGVATAYNIKWMWDCTFSDPNTNRDEKIKAILINKLEADDSIDNYDLKDYKRLIMSGGNEINVIYSHCVESRWFSQTTCIAKDLKELRSEKPFFSM